MSNDNGQDYLKTIQIVFDVAVKAITLLSLICMAIGTSITWLYLYNVGIGYEITTVITSPQCILIIAMVSILLSIAFVSVFVIYPSILITCDTGGIKELKMKVYDNKSKVFNITLPVSYDFLFYFSFTFIGLISQIICLEIYGFIKFNLWFAFIPPILLFFVYLVYKANIQATIQGRVKWIDLIAIFITMQFLYLILFFTLFFMWTATHIWVSNNEGISILSFIMFFILYSLSVSYSVTSN